MVTISASVVQSDGKHFIHIDEGGAKISIPISEDKPNEVKSAFNKLIIRIKEGNFQIQLADDGDDLFSHVAKEYLTQINKEIQEVRHEMQQYGLLEE
jgi:hypothetical protein